METPYLPFKIIVRPLLTMGTLARDNDTGEIAILLCDQMNKQQATETLWHEVLHLLHSNINKSLKHNENKIEEMCVRLAKACPEILEFCGIKDKFPDEARRIRKGTQENGQEEEEKEGG